MRPKGQVDAPAHCNNRPSFFSPLFSLRPRAAPPVSPDEEINNVSPGTYSQEKVAGEGDLDSIPRSPGHIPVEISRRAVSRTRRPRGTRGGLRGEFFRSSRVEPLERRFRLLISPCSLR
ncbi:hypothetical protein DBV15_08393 [Temnothorax longispinosus]|uniref:Uncharacterized protein n=1 Tax=Temnothorax longispinosus TaxID=300112 RepID=A0A4S2JVK1_9HYME|nr:hypothetical protein DBV15_08393 [Temnothorax longispinosus]